MARLHSSGFEQNSVTAGNADVYTAGGSPTISSTTVRSGSYALRISSLASATAQGVLYKWAASTNNGPFYFRAYLNVATLPSAENRIITLGAASGSIAGSTRAYITLDQNGQLRLYTASGPTLIGSASSALSAGWHRIEMKFDASPGAGASDLEAKIDGTVFATSTTVTFPGAVFAYTVGGNLNAEAQTTGDWFFDDIAINDGNGSFQNTYPGDEKLIALYPNAAGDNTQWTRGGTDSGANWSQVDETTPNDATDYVADKTSGNIDDYNLTNSGLSGSDTINVVHVGQRYNGASASAVAAYVLRVKASSGGTVEESAAVTPNSGTWRFAANADPRVYPLTLYDLPGASTTAWTSTDLDNAQIGMRTSTSNTNNAQVSAIWMLVGYTPASSVTTDKTITGQARITLTTDKTITALARITATTDQAVQAQARVTNTSNQTITAISRIGITTDQTIVAKSRITAQTTQTVTGQSRITAQANQTILSLARVTNTASQTVPGQSRITVSTSQTVTAKARIQLSVDKTVTALARITAQTSQTISGKAQIGGFADRTITGLASIIQTISTDYWSMQASVTTSQNITAVSRIANTYDQTIVAKARITATPNQTIPGQARITQITDRTITAVSRITITSLQPIPCQARIQLITAQTLLALSRITAQAVQTIPATSRITITTTQTIVAKARIQLITSQTILAKSRIAQLVDKVILARASVKTTMSQNISGKGAIRGVVLQTITGIARIASADATAPTIPLALGAEDSIIALSADGYEIADASEDAIISISIG
jgi:hypothetical protein